MDEHEEFLQLLCRATPETLAKVREVLVSVTEEQGASRVITVSVEE